MANETIPTASGLSSNLLPDFYQSTANKKFLQSTIDQLFQPGSLKKVNGLIGRKNAKAAIGADIYVDASDKMRQQYQLEPGLIIKDDLGNVSFFKDYIDYINQLNVFGANTTNHARLNKQEFYSWDPHINWDKFVDFQNYYWLPFGPTAITIYGQKLNIQSTYSVEIQPQGNTNEYLFTPNGLDLNPTLKLYRGQTYTFNINSPNNPFSIKTRRIDGPIDRYRATGISGQAVEVGTITFTIPPDAPSVLYYQSEKDINLGGAITIFNIEEATAIDVEKDLLGKTSYILPNGTALSNGMKIKFGENVTPASYKNNNFYVEGVGTHILLVAEKTLEVIAPSTVGATAKFDSQPFDSDPFSDSSGFSSFKDYIVINRASRDHNPWSRYNRWFHKDVIIASATYNNTTPLLDQKSRATRPIIEFEPDLKLFNLGTNAILDVNLVDDFTVDLFSTIEGSIGYNIDGVNLIKGQRILALADTDPLVYNKIFEVDFINIQGRNQIHLTEVASPNTGDTILVTAGTKNKSLMYWFNGVAWILGQQKTNINQPPLFDVVDPSGNSYGSEEFYPGTTFTGTTLFSYKRSSGSNDAVLGFPLSYQNVSNIGDIVFNFNLVTDSFEYKIDSGIVSKKIDAGYLSSLTYGKDIVYKNGWQICEAVDVQAGLRIYKNSNKINNFNIDIFDNIRNLADLTVKIFVNGIRLDRTKWELMDTPSYKQVVLASPIGLEDILTIKTYSAQPINNNGYYEIPFNLQNNPLNNAMTDFTLGEIIDHVNSIVDNATGFIGNFPGANNLRDLGNVTRFGNKFVQHSGPLSLAMYHITSDTNNIIKSIESSKDDYNTFKRSFVQLASTLGVDQNVVNHVDTILQKINANKPTTAPYYFSDMVPYGASVITELTVVDYRIKTYPLSSPFNLDTLSNKSVLIYLNGFQPPLGTQLLYGLHYTFNNQGFIELTNKVNLNTGDTITTVEYDNTDACYVPATPTKLGLWPKYEPRIFLDKSLVTPRNMIQGHDGSLTLAYGDFRDNLILELEKRIFNNIKVEYNPAIFDIDDIIPGYNRTTDYSLTEFNEILAPNFYKWIDLVGVDFTKPLSYDRANSFTYNYSENVAPDGRPTPGYWRGVYQWLLDTDRPHTHPWEMLGFKIMPSWWETVYGPAPYTNNNLILWQDLTTGVIREPGKPIVKKDKFARPFLLKNIPVDDSGNLLSPLQAGLSKGVFTSSTNNNFIFGDVSPVEAAWRRSSYYPFSVIISAILMSPAKTFGLLLDRSRVSRNIAGQLVYSETNLHIKPTDILIPSVYSSSTRIQTAGIVNYIADYILNYIFSNNLTEYEIYKTNLDTLDVNLTYRVGAFTNKSQFNLLLESKTPLSTGNVFIPQEDISVFLNTSSPIKKLIYSGVIITKLSTGFEIKGYSKTQPFFNYFEPIESGVTLNVGGISENYTTWAPNQQYITGSVVKYGNNFYRVITSTVSKDVFDRGNFANIKTLPYVGGVNAIFSSSWDRTYVKTLPYGKLLLTIQEVVDFLLGYGEYLKTQSFVFNDFNKNLGAVANWETSAKEFMFWTTQNWSTETEKWVDWLPNQPYGYSTIVKYNGDYYSATFNIFPTDTFDLELWTKIDSISNIGSSVISLSPGANGITFTTNLEVIDDISNRFNSYEFYRVDGTPIQPKSLNSNRTGTSVTYTPGDGDGIYCASFYLVQNEHVVAINNNDIFNDTIYNPPSGYRRERIKLSAYVTNNWYGGLDIPGFIYDSARTEEWQPWKDYYAGDLVKLGQFYLQGDPDGNVIPGSELIDNNSWQKLSSRPQAKIIPNWTNLATQFTDFYSLDAGSFNSSQQSLAQHLIGYQKREYLHNIIQDDVSEFKFYQGMIREKGTQNVLNKLFNALSLDKKESLVFHEEWAVRVGQYGSSRAFDNIEIKLDQVQFRNNPQGFLLTHRVDNNVNSFIIQQTMNDVYVKPLGYNSKPFPALTSNKALLRSAGFVNPLDVSYILKSLSTSVGSSDYFLNSIDIDNVNNGDYIWCTFEKASWNVYKYVDLQLPIIEMTYVPATQLLTITLENIAPLFVGDYIGLVGVDLVKGFYQISSVILNKIIVSATLTNFPTPFNADNVILFALVSRRIDTIDNVSSLQAINSLVLGDLLWADNSGDWVTYKYTPVYKTTEVVNYEPTVNETFGTSLAINANGTILVAGTTDEKLITYDKVGIAVPWVQRSVITKPFIAHPNPADPSKNNLDRQIGTVLALSEDGTWLAVSSPTAGYASTSFVGIYNTASSYNIGNIVRVEISLNNYAYYRALQTISSAISTSIGLSIGTAVAYWESVGYIPVEDSGVNSTLVKQGAVSLYQKNINNDYTLVDTIISPLPSPNENFGASVHFNGNNLYVGATGYNNASGRVYKLSYKTIPLITSVYNPVGSSLSTVALSSTIGIYAGMTVSGNGFTSNQEVEFVLTKITLANSISSTNSLYSVYNLSVGMLVSGTSVLQNTLIQKIGTDINNRNYLIVGASRDLIISLNRIILNSDPNLTFNVYSIETTNSVILNGTPNSTPTGDLTFSVKTWKYDWTELYTGITEGSQFGQQVSTSKDYSTLLISSYRNIFVYKKINGIFASSLVFAGTNATVSNNGTYLAIADDLYGSADLVQQGCVTVIEFSNNNTTFTEIQRIISKQPENNALFGNKLYFMNDYKTLVIYSKNGDIKSETTFNKGGVTTFDNESTIFTTTQTDNGRVDIYDKYKNSWIFSESLETNNVPTDGYGFGLSVGSNVVVVSAPYTNDIGTIYSYIKFNNYYSWSEHETKMLTPDVSKIKKAFLYNRKTNKFITYLDVVDPLQGKIPGPADEEIKFKTFYDPAFYSTAKTASIQDTVTINAKDYWTTANVGQLWWDLRTTKFVENNLADVAYRNTQWNTLARGAQVDIYEWVESSLLPSAWDSRADTAAGLAVGISGNTLYSDNAYNTIRSYDNISKTFKNTYYYWVKNRKIIPNVPGRDMAANDVAMLIASPRMQAYKCLAITGINSFSLINVEQYLNEQDIVLSIEYWIIDKEDQNIHSQWKLISNDIISEIPGRIEQKWIDSLCGVDNYGRQVPDPTLPVKLRYGIENRPRQGMFINRIEAIKQLIENVNRTLKDNQIVESRNISALDTYDPLPSNLSGLYDTTVQITSQLATQSISSFGNAVLTPIITNGKITGINVISSGKGYLIAPYIQIHGLGINAVIRSTINTSGEITGAKIINSGEGYTSQTTCTVRGFSVLVQSDETSQGGWTIFYYNSSTLKWERTLTQSYDVRKYWNKIDWYMAGFNQFSAADYSVSNFSELNGLNSKIGQLVKILKNNNGKWILLQKYADSASVDWTASYKTVGLEEGTIQFSNSLYKFSGTSVGYDSNIFDNFEFDVEAGKELRVIISCIKNNILIDDLKQNYLDLFFSTVRYTLSEQLYVDWIYKTSFVRATHTVGQLDQPVNYPVDNLNNFKDYISEVKPYRTKIREYVSQYNGVPQADGADWAYSVVSDFDLQPNYKDSKIVNVDVRYENGTIQSNNNITTVYPWKFWTDNVGFKITNMTILNGGTGYAIPPVVTIDPPTGINGIQATATALISNGKVNSIVITNKGLGYLQKPTVTLNGGLNTGGTSATVIATIGNGVVRSNKSVIKFDRLDQRYYFNTLDFTDTFTGTGNRSQWSLTWAPDIRIGKTSVTINGTPVLRELYTVEIVTTTNAGFHQHTGKITFVSSPVAGSTIVVKYNKDVSILNAADRIQYFYNPSAGQLGKDLGQLLTGVDYGGVIVSGLGFNIGSGWGVAPYYTEKWDNRSSEFLDYSVQVTAGTTVFALPQMPPAGTNINVYHKKFVTSTFVADGVKQEFTFDSNITNPLVQVTTVKQTVTISSTYIANNGYDSGGNAIRSAGFTLYIASIAGLSPGMSVYGQGFLSGQKIVKIIGTVNTALQISIDKIPDNIVYRRVYASAGSSGTGLVVSSTEKLIVGMKISTIGTQKFTSNQIITKIISSTVVAISEVPNIALTNGDTLVFSSVPTNGNTLKFTNIAGSKVLTLNSVQGLRIGDSVSNTLLPSSNLVTGITYTIRTIGTTDFTLVGATRNAIGASFIATGPTSGTGTASSLSSFGFDTIIKSIDTLTNSVTLNNIILLNTFQGTSITFYQQLEDLIDMTIVSDKLILKNVYPVGAIINVSGLYPSIRLDDPIYGTGVPINKNAIIKTPVVGSTITPSTIDGGQAVIVITGINDGGVATTATFTEVIDGMIINQSTTNVIQIPESYTVSTGDEFILRYSTSDGSIPPADDDFDTAITGGDLTYSTATGIAPDDIVLDGDGLITPTSSPATEEVVPGQVVDTLAIKVFDQTSSGAASISVSNYITDGVKTDYAIGQTPNSPQAVIVKIGDNIQTIITDYSVDFKNSLIKLKTTPASGQTVSVYSIGFNGSNLLDLDYFIGDGTTKEFVTKAKWTGSVTGLVYIDGVASSVLFFKTDQSYAEPGLTGFRFAVSPAVNSLINYIIVNGNQQTFAITKTESINVISSVNTYTLNYQIGTSLPNESNMFVRKGQTILKSPNNLYFTIGKNRLNYKIDPTRAVPYSVPIEDIRVYVAGNLLIANKDYTVDPSGITVTITRQIYNTYTGKGLVVSIISNSDYFYNSAANQITFKESQGDATIEIISSYVHNILDIQRTTYQFNSNYVITPDTLDFYNFNNISGGIITLDREVIDTNYVWVIKNNSLLTPSIDYKLNDNKQSIQVAKALGPTDTITVITFGNNIVSKSSISYMQFKDMLNRVVYKRLNKNKKTMLAADLLWNSTTITVVDASKFDIPSKSLNKPGVVEIRGERIEYFEISGNILSGLRRATLGTGINEFVASGDSVQFIGASETIPYLDNTVTDTVTSLGTHVVPLSFTPKTNNEIEVFVGGYGEVEWQANILYEIGNRVIVGQYTYECTAVHTSSSNFATNISKWNFFIANIRLRKKSYTMFNVNKAPYSPAGDEYFPADFVVPTSVPMWSSVTTLVLNSYIKHNSNVYLVTIAGKTGTVPPTHTTGTVVNGTTTLLYIATYTSEDSVILRNSPLFGTKVTVIKRTGTDWDGKISPSILSDNSEVANFIKAEPGIWYETIIKYDTDLVISFDSPTASFDNEDVTFDQDT